jgi:hypothetical protein
MRRAGFAPARLGLRWGRCFKVEESGPPLLEEVALGAGGMLCWRVTSAIME